jgi:hypothetical protein
MASIRSRPSSIKSNYSSISTASSSPSISSDEELQTPQTSPLLHPVDHSNLDWNPDGSTSSDQCPLCSSHDKPHALNQSLPSISKLTPMLPMLPEPQMPIATTSFDNGKQRAIESRHAVIAAEEERRGRSRWPRLLFFLSTIDKDSRGRSSAHLTN